MAEYIKRDYIDNILDDYIIDHPLCIDRDAARSVKEKLASIPAADVAPVRHGRWRLVEQERPPCRFFVCDKCAFEALTDYQYCPNCGARMDGGEK